MKKLVLVRHGETIKNESGLIHRRGDEAPLNEAARSQSLLVARVLKSLGRFVLFSSPERRALETAEIVGRENGVTVNLNAALDERNWGIYEGKSWSEVLRIIGDLSPEERYRFVPKGGESWQQMAERAGNFLFRVCRENREKNVVAVSHIGVIRAMIPFLAKLPLAESFKYDPEPLSFTTFQFDSDQFHFESVNETTS